MTCTHVVRSIQVVSTSQLQGIAMKYEIKPTHISEIKQGDTVMINGEMRTVGKNNIKSGFMGITLFGDSYRLGSQPVQKVVIFRAMPNNSWAVAV